MLRNLLQLPAPGTEPYSIQPGSRFDLRSSSSAKIKFCMIYLVVRIRAAGSAGDVYCKQPRIAASPGIICNILNKYDNNFIRGCAVRLCRTAMAPITVHQNKATAYSRSF
jgi:hypothetical protein